MEPILLAAVVSAIVGAASQFLQRFRTGSATLTLKEERAGARAVAIEQIEHDLAERATEAPDAAVLQRESGALIPAGGYTTADDLLRIIEALKPAPAPRETWLSKYGSSLIVAVISFLGVMGAALIPDMLADDKPDCVTYLATLTEVRTGLPNFDAGTAFGEGGIDLGSVESQCGPPEAFFP